MGATPHRWAKAASLRSRSGLSPAVSSRQAAVTATYAFRFGEDQVAVRVTGGRLAVARSDAAEPDAVVRTDPQTFAALLGGKQRLDQARAARTLELSGDPDVVERLFQGLQTPEPAPLP